MSGYREISRAGTVSLFEIDGWFGVIDEDHYRVRFFPHRDDQTFTVGIDAEWNAQRPGSLADYTPRPENGSDRCRPGDASISDDGLLSVLVRQRAPHVAIRVGWTAQLPPEAVEPIRRAIAMAEAALLSPEGAGNSAAEPEAL